MKFLLTENQIEDLFSQYMKQYKWYAWDVTGDDDLMVYDGPHGKKIFYITYYGLDLGAGEDEYSLIINREFFTDVLYLFFGDVLDPWMVVKWFNNEFKTNCVTFDFFDPDDDED